MRRFLFLLLLLALLGVTPARADTQLGVEWRDAATIRVDWSTPGQVSCVYVEERPTGLCGEFGGKLVPFIVYPGQVVTVRAGDVTLTSVIIPASPFPAPMTAAWVGSTLTITITDPAPARCLWLVGGSLLSQWLDNSCGKATYTISYQYLSSGYKPDGRTLQLVDTGALIYALPVPLRSEISLPLVVGP